ncbi:MAG TPA: 30S ribosomal protein S6 [Pyrinomonadaceae bacterium]|nr:30S ribosomal protein S6 [Pyrinomonadaceae bacterium]
MAEKRTYEVVAILGPTTAEDWVSTFNKNVTELIEKLGGTVVNVNDMGVRKLAYKIDKFNEGHYLIFEVDGSGQEVAEVERRFRVNDNVIRYMTIRVDLQRRRAEKFKTRRANRLARRGQSAAARRAERAESQPAAEE